MPVDAAAGRAIETQRGGERHAHGEQSLDHRDEPPQAEDGDGDAEELRLSARGHALAVDQPGALHASTLGVV